MTTYSKAYNSFLERGIDKFDDDEFDKELGKHLEEGKQVSEELKKEVKSGI